MKSFRLGGCAILALGLALGGAPLVAAAKTITVRRGQSIQAAVDSASPGDTVKVWAGDYCETDPVQDLAGDWAAVLVNKPLRLMAMGRVRILGCANPDDGKAYNGIVVEGTKGNEVDGVDVRGFIVKGFANNGIKLRYVKNFNIERNVSIDNLENGIWPTLSANGQVKKNVAYGSKDSALWVEASENVRVIGNDLATSPTGLEVTLSKDVTIEQNNVHDNTVGIGLYHPGAAGLPQEEWPTYAFGNWYVAGNYVHDNNMTNPLPYDPNSEVAQLPPGLGMLILGVDHVDVQRNWVMRNSFVGVALIDWCVAAAIECQTRGVPTGYEDTALDFDRVVGNRFADNHTADSFPDTVPADLQALKSDILYVDGVAYGLVPGTGNCQRDNRLLQAGGFSDGDGHRGDRDEDGRDHHHPDSQGAAALMYTVPPPELIGVDLFPTCD